MFSAPDLSQWHGSTMPLERMSRLASTDLQEIHNHMSEIFCPHKLDIEGGAPPIAFRHNQAALKSVTFNATDYGNPFGRIIVDVPPNDSIYLVQFSLSGTAQIRHGRKEFTLSPGEMCVLNPGVAVRQTFGEGYKHFTVKLTKAGMNSVLADQLGNTPSELIFKAGPVQVAAHSMAFVRFVQTSCDDLEGGESAFDHARAVNAVEETLQRLLLAAAPHNHSDAYNAPRSAAAPYYVRRVEGFIARNLTDAITLEQMIEISGVSARSLHAGFRRFRHTSPMKYLKNARLQLARERLISAVGSGKPVTDIALACGFSHLSNFASDYRERFGERPSETIKFGRE